MINNIKLEKLITAAIDDNYTKTLNQTYVFTDGWNFANKGTQNDVVIAVDIDKVYQDKGCPKNYLYFPMSIYIKTNANTDKESNKIADELDHVYTVIPLALADATVTFTVTDIIFEENQKQNTDGWKILRVNYMIKGRM